MAKIFSTTILIILCALNISANNKISLQSRLKLNVYNQLISKNDSAFKRVMPMSLTNGTPETNVIITLKDGYTIPEHIAEALEMNITDSFGSIIIASMPIASINALSQLDCVEYIEIEQEVHLLTDSARKTTRINPVHTGSNLPMPFKGKGVIVGVIDCGIDYNHVNFKDQEGRTRLIKAGIYNNSVRGLEIYSDKDAIEKLTTDMDSESHGTHVSGIAGGGYTYNNYQGMAPESYLMLFGLGNQLSNVNILRAINTIFDYANANNKPAVINISLGTNTGPHDGTGSVNRSLNSLKKDGNILVFAVGNEGADNICISKKFDKDDTNTPQLSTILYTASTTYLCEVDTWSRSNSVFGMQFFIYDIYAKKEVICSDIIYPATSNYKEFSWSDSELSTYFKGSISVAGSLSSYNRRYEMYTFINGSITKSNYRLGVKFYGKKDDTIDSWANQVVFTNQNTTTYTAGTPDGSYNDMACGENTISVGAYAAKKSFRTVDGHSYTYPNAVVGDIGNFSSYGTDLSGRKHPDVVAPGYCVISSVNGYDSNTVVTRHSYIVSEVSSLIYSRKYHWGDMSGTSMACPVATGTIALWLQANPNLSVDDIHEIIKETSINDTYTQGPNAIMWGAGKLNAYDGIIKALQKGNSGIHAIDAKDVFMVDANTPYGEFSFYFHNEQSVMLNIYSMSGSLLHSTHVDTLDGKGSINLNGKLAPGIYIARVIGSNSAHSTRIIIK